MRQDHAVPTSGLGAGAAGSAREGACRGKGKARAGAPRRNTADEAAVHAAEIKARLLAAARIAFHLGGED